MFPGIAGLMQEPPSAWARCTSRHQALLNTRMRLGKYTEMVGLRRFVWHATLSKQKAALVRAGRVLMTLPIAEVMLMSPRVPVQRCSRPATSSSTRFHAFAVTASGGAHLMSVLERLRDLSTTTCNVLASAPRGQSD